LGAVSPVSKNLMRTQIGVEFKLPNSSKNLGTVNRVLCQWLCRLWILIGELPAIHTRLICAIAFFPLCESTKFALHEKVEM
jgi:hypothetical protein